MTARTPIIAMTANAFKEERDRCLKAGMDDYLSKPIRAHDLEATLARWTTVTDLPRPVSPTTPGNDTSMGLRIGELLGDHTPTETSLTQQIVASFITQAATLISSISIAISDGDAAALAYHAHTLKGAAANLGANDIADACTLIENLGRAGETARATSHHARLTALLDQAATELTDILSTLARTQQTNP